MTASTSSPKKFGPLRLMPGVGRRHITVYYLATITSLLLFTFAPQAQPFVLTEILGIPESQQGVLSGNIAFVAELVILASIGSWGVLSDRLGRRPIFAAGFLIMAVGLYLIPQATTVFQLYLYRCIFALGAAAGTTMVATVIADYVVDEDRGKGSGMQGIGNGIGAMLTVFVLLRFPEIFQESGSSPTEAAQSTYLIAAIIGIISAIVMWLGLQGRTEQQIEQKKGWLQRTREGFGAARDPGVALAYAAAFVSRGDLAVVGTFFTLWATTYGTTEANLSAAEALATAGLVIGISQGVTLLTAPIFGIMADRMNRVTAVLIALALSGIGYGSTIFVESPLSGFIFISAALIGLGEISGVIASGVLIAQQAPRDIRGSVIGVFSFCGAIGILAATGIGGQLFDSWRPQGPFLLFSFFSFVALIWGLTIRHKVVPLNEDIESVGH
ncbi:MAG: MFS transporter [Chloroflexota bacterium]